MTPAEIVDLLNENLGEISTTMGIRFTSSDPQCMTADMPVEGNRQPFGMLHGGASALLAETLGSLASSLLAPPGKVPVGIELSCSHHRSATSGMVHASATPINVGRTLATIDVKITDDEGRSISTCRLTCLFREPPAGIQDPRERHAAGNQ
jgi:1,4-dihydroxy-2-naphthoyl-CoA hydrolase